MSYSKPIYMSQPPGPPQDRRQQRSQPPETMDDSAIEPSLVNLMQHSPDMYSPPPTSGEMTSDQERAFSLQLQAAAAAASVPAHHQGQEMATPEQEKTRRLGRACDVCSKRKVKCGGEVPCKSCVDIGIACTFARPAKRRGPANKVALSLKWQRLSGDDDEEGPSEQRAITHASANELSYLTIETVAPLDTVHRLIFDFFTYIHPIYPFPHEHLVMDRLKKREDIQNKSFCALLASMLATVAAVYPRIAQKALSQHAQEERVLKNNVFIGRCLLTCQQSRGPLTSGRDVDDAATSFFVGLVSYLRKLPGQLELYATEALSIVRYLGVERDGIMADKSLADPVTKELSTRIYWAVYALSRSLQQTGEIQDLIPPRRESQLPSPPLLTDDYYIYKDRVQAQPHGQLSTIEGFSLLCSIYSSYHALARFDVLDEEDRDSPSTKQDEITHLKSLLRHLDTVLDAGHPELASLPSPDIFQRMDNVPGQQARMHLRWESQKIMLRAGIVRTRHHLTQRLVDVQDGHGSDDDEDGDFVDAMRRTCRKELAELMANVTKASLEPVARLVAPPLRRVSLELGMVSPGTDSDMQVIVEKSAELFDQRSDGVE